MKRKERKAARNKLDRAIAKTKKKNNNNRKQANEQTYERKIEQEKIVRKIECTFVLGDVFVVLFSMLLIRSI